MPDLEIKQLGRQPYPECVETMRRFTNERNELSSDQLWLAEHDPVFTLGQAGKAEHLLNPHDIPVIQTDRGGQVTYHGPGQIIIYCLIDLKRSGLGPRALVNAIEKSIIQTLAQIGIEAFSKKEAPGVYVLKENLPEPMAASIVSEDAKIAALGLRIRKGCSYHGLSLNFDMDLSPFSYINPCGYQDQAVCQVRDFNRTVSRKEIETGLCESLANILEFESEKHE